MNNLTEKIIEGTVTALLVFWVIARSADFSAVVGASTSALVGSVQALQGR